MERKVVVTGIGVISPVGSGKDKFWQSLIGGKSGIDRISSFDPSAFDSQVAGEVKDFDPEDFLPRREYRKMDRFSQFAVCASIMAMQDADVTPESMDEERAGVILGSGIGGIQTFEDQHQVLLNKGPGKISAFFIPMMIVNMGAANVAIQLKLKGPSSCVSTACEASTHALGEALRIIQRREADLMVVVGAEASITPLALAGFCAMKALSTHNDEPSRASRPFDRTRDGFVMAEGAAALILEEEERAKKRGARIYAELKGYGSTCDAYHITAPDPEGEGAARSMKVAIEDARLTIEDIDYINAHGTSTPLNDKVETMAIKKVFGERAYQIKISSTKSMTGHLLGGAGALEGAATVLSIYHGIIPPTINLQERDPDCDLDYTPDVAFPLKIRNALSNSFGFGGHNGTLVFSSYGG
ncbi:MAG TPA: beta-ketoacyl-ACP synthase II [Candidatus Atribacteria bacterium]|nr:beta-ketoacyl-ACP synthase II [Candidatus Atribacteria bacterium]HQE24966.1 beta-ketoacyl-ACP synthase II [Candidatus Atribacteria bacterium]